MWEAVPCLYREFHGALFNSDLALQIRGREVSFANDR
jgi:hypothetical protein